jgi:hypothetical protein
MRTMSSMVNLQRRGSSDNECSAIPSALWQFGYVTRIYASDQPFQRTPLETGRSLQHELGAPTVTRSCLGSSRIS